jgi:hypothetical protein
MARKRKRAGDQSSGRETRSARIGKSRSIGKRSKTSVSSHDTPVKPVFSKRKLPERSQSARSQGFAVLRKIREGQSLTAALKDSGTTRPTFLRYFGSELRTDSSGRIHPRSKSDSKRETLLIPNSEGGRTPVPTRGSSERKRVGEWMAALNAAGDGDFSLIRAFPKRLFIGGVRLPTSDYEVQRILEALEDREEPYEGLYRTLARPS